LSDDADDGNCGDDDDQINQLYFGTIMSTGLMMMMMLGDDDDVDDQSPLFRYDNVNRSNDGGGGSNAAG